MGIERDTLIDDSLQACVLLTQGKAGTCKTREGLRTESLTGEEVGRMIRDGEIGTSGIPPADEPEKRMARAKRQWIDRRHEKSIQDKKSFLQKVEIDYASLFQD